MKYRDIGVVQLLVNMGAKISATDDHGDNSLHIALRAKSRRLAQILLVNPGDSKLLYRPNKLGETPYSIGVIKVAFCVIHPIFRSRNIATGTSLNIWSRFGWSRHRKDICWLRHLQWCNLFWLAYMSKVENFTGFGRHCMWTNTITPTYYWIVSVDVEFPFVNLISSITL